MSNIDLQPVEDQIKKINSAAYRVLYNLLSKTYNIEKQYMGFKVVLESNSPTMSGNWKFTIRKKTVTALNDTIKQNYARIKDNLFGKLKFEVVSNLSGKADKEELEGVFTRVIKELENDFKTTYKTEADLQLDKKMFFGGKKSRRRKRHYQRKSHKGKTFKK